MARFAPATICARLESRRSNERSMSARSRRMLHAMMSVSVTHSFTVGLVDVLGTASSESDGDSDDDTGAIRFLRFLRGILLSPRASLPWLILKCGLVAVCVCMCVCVRL